MAEKIRVIIADDQNLITQSFKILLETLADDIEVVGLARDGQEAATLTEELKPDVVLMDVRMPNMDGVQATGLIHKASPEVRIIMLTTFDDDNYVHEAIASGAVGYLLKDISTDELISSIRAVRDGALLLSGSIGQRLLAGEGPGEPRSGERRDELLMELVDTLSKKEVEILRLLARGYENKEIAAELCTAEQTVKNNLSMLYAKLGVGNRREARRFALKSGLIRPEDILRDS
jgi:DNA-binding NarL/FixJ family response regulator